MAKKKNEIKVSNYVILLIIFVAVIGCTFAARNIYLKGKENILNEMILTEVLTNKLNFEELDNYVLENPDSTFFVSINGDVNSKNIESDVKDIIVSNNLNNDIIYINLFNSDKNKFINKINKKYNNMDDIKELPVVLSFSNGKVVKVLENEDIVYNFKDFMKRTRSN